VELLLFVMVELSKTLLSKIHAKLVPLEIIVHSLMELDWLLKLLVQLDTDVLILE
jgi:hypothetical protein